MTQHILPEHEAEDQATLRRLALVVAGFMAATAVMALSIGLIAG